MSFRRSHGIKARRVFFIHSIDPVRWILLMIFVRPFYPIVCFRYRAVKEIGFRRLRADTISYHEFSDCMRAGVAFAARNDFGTIYECRLDIADREVKLTNQIAKHATNYIKDLLIAAEILSKSDNSGVFVLDAGIIRSAAVREEIREHFQERSGLAYTNRPLLDHVDNLIKVMAVFAYQAARVLKNTVKSAANNTHKYRDKIIYNDLTPTDMNLNAKEKLSTTFLVGREGLKKEDIVFIAHDRKKSEAWRSEGYHVVGSMRDLLHFGGSLRVAVQFLTVFVSRLRFVYTNISFIQTIINIEYIILINTVLRHLDLRGLIYSVSSIGNGPIEALPFLANEQPVVLFLYSSNVNVLPYYAYLNCTHLIVWNQYTKEVIGRHPQTEDVSIIKAGTVMMADDDLDEEIIRSAKGRYLPDRGSSRFVIGVFDIAPPRPSFLERIRCPSAYTQDFHARFMFDIFRLSEDFEEVNLLIKPKRWSQHHSVDDRVVDHIADRSDVITLLPPQINPYLSIVMCDLVICMPFSSPLIAAWQKGIPGFYYAPLNQEQYFPEEPVLAAYLIKGYRDLKQAAAAAINDFRGDRVSVPANHFLTGIENGSSVTTSFKACLASIFIDR